MTFLQKYRLQSTISILLSFILVFNLSPILTVHAQSDTDYPVYVVQNGDTLGLIATRFGISIEEIKNANGIIDPNSISIGMELIIPGLKDVNGLLISESISPGESLNSLSVKHRISQEQLAQLNDLSSPSQIYSGANLILPQRENIQSLTPITVINNQQSILELAILMNTNPWSIIQYNQRDETWNTLPGETLFYIIGDNNITTQKISPPIISSFQISPFIIVQGATISFLVETIEAVNITGSLSGLPLNFFQNSEFQYAALQGVHAKTNPGLLELVIILDPLNDQHPQVYLEQTILITADVFGTETLIVDPITIDPAYTQPEDDQVFSIVKPATAQKMWSDAFVYPVDEPICIQSYYGTRRSYNGSPYTYFHTGLDFGVCAPSLNIYSPAPGIVVFSGPLIVRGNAVIVDHGWGIYSGFYHMKEINVQYGDQVDTKTIIGIIGATGRVTGPHLHYDLFVNGIQVQPFDWFLNTYP